MPKFYVHKQRRMDFGMEVEVDSEDEALELVKEMPEEDLNDEGCDTFWEVEEIEE